MEQDPRIWGAQHIGNREEQQDRWDAYEQGDAICLLLSDGMGGMTDGGRAAQTAVQEAKTALAEGLCPQQALLRAARAVYDEAARCGADGKTGATLIVACVEDGGLDWAAAGDSRLFLCREGKLIQLTHDHNYAYTLSRLVARGEMNASAPFEDTRRGSLISWLGMPKLKLVDMPDSPIPLQPGDLVLLCSDGCYDAIGVSCGHPAGAQETAERLVAQAVSRGLSHQDNATCVAYRHT